MKIKYVAQEDDRGCAIACIAMVLGWSYAKVTKQFHCDFSKAGIKPEQWRNFICEHGFSSVEKIAYGYMDISASNKRMAIPFAPVHVLSVAQFADSEENHALVMGSQGKVYDPGKPEGYDLLEMHYEIVRIMGFWDERWCKMGGRVKVTRCKK